MTRYDTAEWLFSYRPVGGRLDHCTWPSLQELIAFLIEPLPGVEISAENTFNIGRTAEKDLWLQHAREAAGMPFDDREIPVECKNEKDKTGPTDISWFAEKIRNSGGRDGLLVTTAGLSGRFQSGGHEEIRNQLKKGAYCRRHHRRRARTS
jgi:hypothetical protein